MPWQLASLGSGSKGNATLLRFNDQLILIDCGFTAKETTARLARLGLSPEQLSAVLVTHEHGDHVRGVGPLARRYQLPVYASHGTRANTPERVGLEQCQLHEVRPGRPFQLQQVTVLPVAVPHDAREPCQYVLSAGQRRLGVLTDLGSITGHVVDSYRHCDALVLETNHDSALLAAGPYPEGLKRRVGGDLGHLSNDQSAALLAQVDQRRLQHLVLSHLSEQNNTPAHALAAAHKVLDGGHDRITVADQDQGCGWLQII